MKIIKLFLLLQTLFFYSLFANVNLSMNDKGTKGERFNFTIELIGENIDYFPDFSNIDGNIVQEISTNISTSFTNGKIVKAIKKIYSFEPTKSFLFPSLNFVIDGIEYKTSEKNIIIENPSKTISSIFDLSINSEKNEFYVNENFILKVVFKYKKNMQIVDLSLDKPNFKDFWYKQIEESKSYEEGEYNVIELGFLLTPLNKDIKKIEPLSLNVQILDDSHKSFFSSTKVLKIYSNELNLNIKELPNNIILVGDFKIESSVDKQKVKVGEAVSYKLKIKGNGNIDDIPDIKLPLTDITIYENKPIIKTKISENEYVGEYEKTFLLISDRSFEIPALQLEYFDKNRKEVIKKNTNSFYIEILSNDTKETLLQKEIKIEKQNEDLTKQVVEISILKQRVLFFILGVVFCLLIISLYFYVINSKQKKECKNSPLTKRVSSSKSKEELIKILAIYLKVDSKLDELILKLEKDEDFKSLKKEILKVLKNLKL